MSLLDNIFKLPGFVLATISTILLIILGYFCWQSEEQAFVDNSVYLDNPQLYKGREIMANFCSVDEKLANEIISINKHDRAYIFVIDTSLVKLNHIYSFKGNISSDGKIIVTDFQKHPHRVFKYLFSLFSFPILIFLIIKYIRFDKSSFTFIIKQG